MRHERADSNDKGWVLGPWNSDLAVSIGYANTGIDEPHVHQQMSEVYLVAQGTAQLRVEHETISLQAGDIIVIEPGEAHTFIASSPDYFHFVVHTPALAADEARQDKQQVARDRLGLS